jgi:hypothetical protein
MVFVVVLAVALNGGLTVAVVELPLPGMSWLTVLLLILAVAGPWVVLWGILKAQLSCLNETCGKSRTAQALVHMWLTAQIAGAMAVSYLRSGQAANAWNDAFTVLTMLMVLAVLLLPAFRREAFRLWTPQARVVISRASLRASAIVFGSLWLWAYLSPAACPQRQCLAGGSHGVIWALVFSAGCAWLIAAFLVQLGSILRWLDDRSRNPGPPPQWFRRLVHVARRPQSA